MYTVDIEKKLENVTENIEEYIKLFQKITDIYDNEFDPFALLDIWGAKIKLVAITLAIYDTQNKLVQNDKVIIDLIKKVVHDSSDHKNDSQVIIITKDLKEDIIEILTDKNSLLE